MRRHAFKAGSRVRLDGRRLRIVGGAIEDGVEKLTLVNNVGMAETFDLDDLQTKYCENELTFEDADDDGNLTEGERRRRKKADETNYAMLPEEDRARIEFRRFVVSYVDQHAFIGRATSSGGGDGLSKLLEQAVTCATALHGRHNETVSRSTYYLWRRLYKARGNRMDLQSHVSQRGNRNQLDPTVSAAIAEAFGALFEASRVTGMVEPRPVLRAMEAVRAKVGNDKLPHQSTFYRQYKRYDAVDRDRLERGKTWVKQIYRRTGEKDDEPENALDVAQFDETRLPFFVVHDILGIPLGRPWLAFLVDVYSEVPLGFSLGFTPPSDELFASTIRHACLPKAYMRGEYVDLQWKYSGIPRLIVFDNSLTAHSNSIESITANSDIPYKFCPRKTPQAKSAVEKGFKVTNDLCLSGMPGFVLPSSLKVSSDDYNASKNAVVTFSQLERILHHFFLGLYVKRKVNGVPLDQLWTIGTQDVRPEFPSDARDLDLVFGIRRQGKRLDERGIQFHGLEYYSDETQAIRNVRGAKSEVEVCLNPSDMSTIYVLDDGGVWRRVRCRERDYASRVTYYQHQRISDHARDLFGKDDLGSRLEAREDLNRIIRDVLREENGLRTANLSARALGISSDRILVPPPSTMPLPQAKPPPLVAPAAPSPAPIQDAIPVAPPRPPRMRFPVSSALKAGRGSSDD